MLMELLIYMMIGLVLSLYRYRGITQFKAILTIFFWPLVLLHSYVELVERVKYKNRKR
ncbi:MULTISPECIES: hypothetical protein [Metabacillus]|uniref:hypothetical protein n=1 Tax=Metabacillus TaxID=2675233 RepID=UPI001B9E80F9|nr:MULTISPECIES: hypothetical protein [Metabacillus]UGB30540.1 hypothetical protein LPC09_23055 [Metabacillus sp. B2-18]UHA61472.1 hypothetical protein KDJ21_007385 [Metabacillus litoralis]